VNGQALIGSFAPEQPLSAFDGQDPNGIWTLNISDNAGGNSGTLRRFSLVLDTLPIDIAVDQFDDPNPVTCTPGSCSLREAVQLANAQAGPNRIVLPAGTYTLSRAGANENANGTGDLDVTDDLILAGAGATSTTLTQTTADRVLHVVSSQVNLTLRDLTVSGGSGVDDGGAIYMPSGRLEIDRATLSNNRALRHGGAIYNNSGGSAGVESVLMRACRFEGNQATNTTANGAFGGAFYTLSSGFSDVFMRIEGCTFVDNRADDGGGALGLDGVQSVSGNTGTILDSTFTQNQVTAAGRGGAIGTNVDASGLFYLDIQRSTFEQNAAPTAVATGAGGAISVVSGTATIRDSLFTGNTANIGGAISGDVTLIEDSTVCGNAAINDGGAVRLGSIDATLARNTFCDNAVTTSDVGQFGGGAISKPLGNLTLERNTLQGNSAVRGAGIAFGGNDLILRGNTIVAPSPLPPGALGSVMRYTNADTADSLFLYNNILIGQCSYTTAINPGVALSNIEASGNTCRLLLAVLQAGNQTAVSGNAVNLGPLADNGGPTDTRLPQAPSIAIDSGSNTACTSLDQRGYQRNDAQCDVGSVEVGGTLPPEAVFADGFE
jgi:CSLREA domain-containing protein